MSQPTPRDPEPDPDCADGSTRATPTWDSLSATLYGELRQVATGMMRSERRGHTLQPTAVVNEACLRIARAGLPQVPHHQRLAIAARIMEQVLIDHARKHNAAKRGGGEALRIQLDGGVLADGPANADVDLDLLRTALAELRSLHPRQAEGVTLRIMAGMTSAQVAEVLGVSLRTVEADWAVARAWLRRRLAADDGAEP